MSLDTQILVTGVTALPVDYTVPNAQELIPLAITAEIDGSATAADYVPTIEIISDGGVVIARVPTTTTVSAGQSAEVTWAPFLDRRGGTVSVWPTTGYGTTILAGNPFAYYPLDEAVGATIHDQSGNGHDLTNFNAAPIYNVKGLIPTNVDGALYNPLGADVAKCPRGAFNWTPNTFTAVAWIQVWTSDLINEIVTYQLSTQKHEQKFQLRLNAGKPEMETYDAADNNFPATGATDIRDGKGHMVAGVYDGTNTKVYLDGAIAATTVGPGTPTFVNGALGVGGAQALLTASNIDGIIDEVAIYSTALSASDILALYTAATSV